MAYNQDVEGWKRRHPDFVYVKGISQVGSDESQGAKTLAYLIEKGDIENGSSFNSKGFI